MPNETNEPGYQDYVKNKHNDMTGIVIAKYVVNRETYLDVRGFDDRIYYGTRAKNWTTVSTEEERVE